MNPKTAALIGATGLIGNHLMDLLLNDKEFSEVRLLVRRPLPVSNPKAKVLVIDFEDETAFKNSINGCDAVFVAVGTTQRKVKGDKAAYRKVDYDIPVNAARFCEESGCQNFLMVSSVGANAKGGNFYIKLKGEVEERVQTFDITSISIFRPSMLLGNRQESRPMESFAQVISRLLSFLFPSNYRPIEAKEVAKSMAAASKLDKPGFRIYHYKEMQGFLASSH
jgi:uncharacterized protein YbjT (DUF2867 family)